MISSFRLWGVASPYRYVCRAELIKNGGVIDTMSVRFGFRRAEFTPDNGFMLNGRQVKLHVCCEHHDLGALGAAFNINAMRRKFEKLRTMGVNALRTTHKAFTDPYEFVSGGLCSSSSGDVSNGLEHGIRFGDEGGYAVFENVDFGDTGSGRITLPVFADSGKPVRINIYDGMPENGGTLIGSKSIIKNVAVAATTKNIRTCPHRKNMV